MKFEWKKRNLQSHKGQNGKVLVIGGSEHYIGAPALVAMAALRAGCDNATVAAPQQVAWVINALSPDMITKKLPGKLISKNHLDSLLVVSAQYDVVVLGNGMGKDARTKGFVHDFIKKVKKPMVIDADALHMVKIQQCTNTLFTPHQGEWKVLSEHSDIIFKDEPLPDLKQNTILLKGPEDIIIGSHSIAHNMTGHSGMTTAGTGDVLAGVAASFIAQGYSLFDAACRAAYITGLAGERLGMVYGNGYTAQDVAHMIQNVMHEVGAWQ